MTVLTFCLTLIGCSGKTPPTVQETVVETASFGDQEMLDPSLPFLAIWVENWGWGAGRTGLIAAIWDDGRIVWSSDSITGGPPYKEAKIDTDGVAAMVSQLAESGTLSKEEFQNAHFGPDSTFTVINMRHNDAMFSLASWHDIAEAGSETVVGASYGLTTTGGKSREEFLKDEPEEYLEFRDVWQRIRDTVSGSLPDDGIPVTASIKTADKELGQRDWPPNSE